MVVTWPSVNRGKPTLRISSCISGMRVESLPTPENLICATAYVSGGRSRINRFGYRSTLKLYTKLYMKVNRVSILRCGETAFCPWHGCTRIVGCCRTPTSDRGEQGEEEDDKLHRRSIGALYQALTGEPATWGRGFLASGSPKRWKVHFVPHNSRRTGISQLSQTADLN